MQHKIYFNHKPLYLVNEITPEIDEFLHHEETILVDEFSLHSVKAMIHEMESDKILRGVFVHDNIDEVLHAFKKKLNLIVAAGGLVESEKGELLLIFRRGKWDLPKGKLDAKEEIAKAAVREVEEETGVKNVKLNDLILKTYHTYHEERKHIIKETYWYKMDAKHQELTPQTNEDIEKCEWIKPGDLSTYMDNAHPSVVDVIRKAIPGV